MKSTTWKRGVLTLAGVFALCVALLSGARRLCRGNQRQRLDAQRRRAHVDGGHPTATTYDWTQYASQITEVKVAESVTEIPGTAFASCTVASSTATCIR